MAAINLHACAIAIGPLGLLIRGGSGSGKSTLSDCLVEAARLKGHFACVVADDRCMARVEGGRLLVYPPDSLAGYQEVRGLGICDRFGRDVSERRSSSAGAPPALTVLRVRLVCDLAPLTAMERLPEPTALRTELLGLELPRILLPQGDVAVDTRLLRWAMRRFFPNHPDYV